jgi:hypothetical protein
MSIHSNYSQVVYEGFISNSTIPQQFKSLVTQEKFNLLVNPCESKKVEEIVLTILQDDAAVYYFNCNRYKFIKKETNRKRLLNLIFEQSFNFSPSTHIQAIQLIENKIFSFVNLQKKTPKKINIILINKFLLLFGYTTIIITSWKIYWIYYKIYSISSSLINNKIIFSLINRLPDKSVLLSYNILQVYKQIAPNVFLILATLVVWRVLIENVFPDSTINKKLPKIHENKYLIRIISLIEPVNLSIIRKILEQGEFLIKKIKDSIYYFDSLTQKIEKRKLSSYKIKCIKEWEKIIQNNCLIIV